MTTPPITLGSFNLEVQDPVALGRFWSSVTGGSLSINGESAYLQPAGPGGFAMFFQPLGDAEPGRQTTHLDLTVPWGSRQSEVDRIVALGATWQWDVLDEHPHVRWTTLADPEGHLFCVAEHPPAQ